MRACVVVCASCVGNELGAEAGAVVAEALKSCTQLTSVDLMGTYSITYWPAVRLSGWAGWHSCALASLRADTTLEPGGRCVGFCVPRCVVRVWLCVHYV